jgi:competence protein ComEA
MEILMKLSKFIGAALMVLAINAWAAVDINTASGSDLDSIKGIGPGTSAKILEQRKSGKFKDWADLIQRVTGIGAVRAGKLSSEGLTVNGTPFKSAPQASGNRAMTKKVKDDTKSMTK